MQKRVSYVVAFVRIENFVLTTTVMFNLWKEVLCLGVGHGPSFRDVAQILWLTPLALNKLAAISQTTFQNVFSWTKKFLFWFKFRWSLFLSEHRFR